MIQHRARCSIVAKATQGQIALPIFLGILNPKYPKIPTEGRDEIPA